MGTELTGEIEFQRRCTGQAMKGRTIEREQIKDSVCLTDRPTDPRF